MMWAMVAGLGLTFVAFILGFGAGRKDTKDRAIWMLRRRAQAHLLMADAVDDTTDVDAWRMASNVLARSVDDLERSL